MKSSEEKLRLLVISQYFYPEEFRINDLCSAWVTKGYDVTVITGIPNYPKGKFFQGYGLFKRRKDNYQGVTIVRLPILPRGKGFLRLSLNYLSFVVSGFFWATFTRLNAEFVFINEVSPMTQALPGIWFANRRNIPVYLYVQDLWPENIEATLKKPHPKFIRVIDRLVRSIYQNVDKIFVSSQGYINNIASKGVSPDKLLYWPQFAEDFYQPLKRVAEHPIPNTPSTKVIFTGNMGIAQGLDTLLEAAKLLQDEAVEFYLVGNGSEKEHLQTSAKNLKHVFFLDAVPANEVSGYLAQCDLAYVSLLDEPIYEVTVPAKLQSYLASGIPVLASATGEVKRIVLASNAGFVCPPGQALPVVASIRSYKSMKKDDHDVLRFNAEAYYQANFNKNTLLDQMDSHLIGEDDEV